jgi:hypothetical protein
VIQNQELQIGSIFEETADDPIYTEFLTPSHFISVNPLHQLPDRTDFVRIVPVVLYNARSKYVSFCILTFCNLSPIAF